MTPTRLLLLFAAITAPVGLGCGVTEPDFSSASGALGESPEFGEPRGRPIVHPPGWPSGVELVSDDPLPEPILVESTTSEEADAAHVRALRDAYSRSRREHAPMILRLVRVSEDESGVLLDAVIVRAATAGLVVGATRTFRYGRGAECLIGRPLTAGLDLLVHVSTAAVSTTPSDQPLPISLAVAGGSVGALMVVADVDGGEVQMPWGTETFDSLSAENFGDNDTFGGAL